MYIVKLGAPTPDCSADDTQVAVEKVYHNDLIMHEILSYILLLKDRINVELSSKRLYALSARGKIAAQPSGNHISFSFCTHHPNCIVEVEDEYFIAPCLTFAKRRDFSPTSIEQPGMFLNLLKLLARRYGNTVRTISFGGRRGIDTSRNFYQSQLLILTSDLLKWVNEYCPNLRELNFDEIVVDSTALNYFRSDECTIPSRLTSVGCERLCFDDKEAVTSFFSKLISPTVSSVSLNSFHVLSQGKALIDVLTEKAHKLELLSIGIDDLAIGGTHQSAVSPVESGRTFLEGASASTRLLHLRLWEEPGSRNNGSLYTVFHDVACFSNVTSLEVNLLAWEMSQLRDLAYICRNIDHMKLERFSFGGYQPLFQADVVLKCLVAGLSGCSWLTSVSLSSIPDNTNPDLLVDLLNSVPKSVRRLSLSNSPFTNAHVQQLAKSIPNLTSLSLKSLDRATVSLNKLILRNFKFLEELENEIPCRMDVIDLLTANESGNRLPIRSASVSVIAYGGGAKRVQRQLEDRLGERFREVNVQKRYGRSSMWDVEVKMPRPL